MTPAAMTFNVPSGPANPSAVGGTTGFAGVTGPSQCGNEVQQFLTLLDSGGFSIESPISEAEAEQAICLFSVVNIMLGGMSRYKVGNEEKTDVLGALTLFYGLQAKALPAKIVVRSSQLWTAIQVLLKELRDELDTLGADAEFLMREAKRQFNLSRNNEVTGNTAFPGLFRRYVEIVSDPLLSIDIRAERSPNSFFDKEKINKAIDLLRELKAVILQLVRSLSKYGTVATSQANSDWASYEFKALTALNEVAQQRISDDLDELNPWAVLADLIGKDRDREIAPYVALGREGGRLLLQAMETYRFTREQLDNFDDEYLLTLFQAGSDQRDFLTTHMRDAATVVKRYPLQNWG